MRRMNDYWKIRRGRAGREREEIGRWNRKIEEMKRDMQPPSLHIRLYMDISQYPIVIHYCSLSSNVSFLSQSAFSRVSSQISFSAQNVAFMHAKN